MADYFDKSDIMAGAGLAAMPFSPAVGSGLVLGATVMKENERRNEIDAYTGAASRPPNAQELEMAKDNPYEGMTHERVDNAAIVQQGLSELKVGAKRAGEFLLDMTPVIGDVKGGYDLMKEVQKDGWTGENLLFLGAIALPYAPSGVTKQLAKTAKSIWRDIKSSKVNTNIYGYGDNVRTTRTDLGVGDVEYHATSASYPDHVIDQLDDYYTLLAQIKDKVPRHRWVQGVREMANYTRNPDLLELSRQPSHIIHGEFETARQVVATDGRGGYAFLPQQMDENHALGSITTSESDKLIETSFTAPLPIPVRRNGVGLELYGAVIAHGANTGKRILSDSLVSPHAQRVYRSLNRRGINVEINPRAVRDGDGSLAAPRGESVFAIRTDAPSQFLHKPGVQLLGDKIDSVPPGGDFVRVSRTNRRIFDTAEARGSIKAYYEKLPSPEQRARFVEWLGKDPWAD